MSKKLFLVLLLSSAAFVLLVACAGVSSGTPSTSSTPSTTQNAVHTSDMAFVTSSITIKKGESITLVTDTVTPHIIANGTWDNGTAKPTTESGAPMVKDVQLNGNGSETIGPFPTVGTFKLYCTIHPGMNLTVVVQ